MFERQAFAAPSRRSKALPIAALAVVLLIAAVSVLASFWTERLWFLNTGYSKVFNTLILTRIGLFVVFGLAMALAVGINIWVAYRLRPFMAMMDQSGLDRYRDVVIPMRKWLLIGVSLVIGAFTGASASGQWRTFLMWRNATEFGSKDPYFGIDLGFFVFSMPWWQFLVDFAMAATLICAGIAALIHYLFGGISLQSRAPFSKGAQIQLSVLVGLFVLAKAADYWLSRYDLLTDAGGLFTGMTYTNYNSMLPARNIMAGIAVVCALLFFVNVWRRTWMLPATGLVLMVVSALLLGLLWPTLVQRFQVLPSQPEKEAPYLQKNIDATRAAYGLEGAAETVYPGSVSVEGDQLREKAFANGIRLVDPALVAATFEQRQQIKGYYSVAEVLDVDRYEVDDRKRDLVVSVREVDQSGIPADARNWNNLHTVYTHGYGMVAAFGNQRTRDDRALPPDGELAWAERDLPPQGVLTDMGPYEPRVYFGEQSPSYSIVGKPQGGTDVELDLPEDATGGGDITSTYEGTAGVPVGSLFNKLLYAVKFGEPNILLSSRVHGDSKIIYDRGPRERVEKVAPWLTVDRDPFPAMVDGRIVWILDGYTATDRYPLSEKESFEAMTDDALDDGTQFRTLPTDEINYMRNAVKATVDAYDGTVTLFAWDESDPMLAAWREAFPGTVKDRSEIPEGLMQHLRYPEDLFKVQRFQLAAYHVEQAPEFYAASDKWRVPTDPNVKGKLQPPYRLSVVTPDLSEKDEPVFSLTSVYTPHNRDNLAAFISVNADASDEKNYGKIDILSLRGGEQVPGPNQIANAFANDQALREALLPFTQQESAKVIWGNLLTLPVGDGLMYVQPIYTQRGEGEGTYPVARFVAVSFGDEVGFGRNLDQAISDILGEPMQPDDSESEPGSGSSSEEFTGEVSAEVARLLGEAQTAYAAADRAQREGDLVTWAEQIEKARELIDRALELSKSEGSGGSGGGSGNGSGNGGGGNGGG